MNVDEFMKSHSGRAGCRAILEPGERPEHIKITLWRRSGCACHNSIEVPKGLIGDLKLTGEVTHCCGKIHQVVDLRFAPGAEFLSDLLLRTSEPGPIGADCAECSDICDKEPNSGACQYCRWYCNKNWPAASRRVSSQRLPPDKPDDPCFFCNEDYGRCIDSGRSTAECFRRLQSCMQTCVG